MTTINKRLRKQYSRDLFALDVGQSINYPNALSYHFSSFQQVAKRNGLLFKTKTYYDANGVRGLTVTRIK